MGVDLAVWTELRHLQASPSSWPEDASGVQRECEQLAAVHGGEAGSPERHAAVRELCDKMRARVEEAGAGADEGGE